MSNTAKNILTSLCVLAILGIIGADSWLIFSQILGPIIPVIVSVIITVILTLFVYNLISKIKPKEEKQLCINEENKCSDNFDIDNNNVSNIEL